MRYRNKLLSNRERIEIIDFLTNDNKFFSKGTIFFRGIFKNKKTWVSYFTNWVCSSVNIFKK